MIRKLARSVRQYKKDTIIAPTLAVLEAAMDVIIPMLMASLIDDGIDGKDMGYVIRMGAVLLLAALLALTFGSLSGRSSAISSSGLARNLRQDMYYNVQNFSFSNIDKFSTASIITRLTTDVTNVQNAYQMLVRQIGRAHV